MHVTLRDLSTGVAILIASSLGLGAGAHVAAITLAVPARIQLDELDARIGELESPAEEPQASGHRRFGQLFATPPVMPTIEPEVTVDPAQPAVPSPPAEAQPAQVPAETPHAPVSPPITPSPVPDTSELGGAVSPASVAAAVATPCEHEDSINCFWRADLRGNGEGTSFLNVEGHIFPLTSVLEG